MKVENSQLPAETDEQRVRRLRKEQRRKLKVHFKPDDTLVEVYVFSHDPDEELGHDASQTRDVGDVDSEGRMFKMRQAGDMMEIDEEDDDDDGTAHLNDQSQPMRHPSLIDFTVLDDADREQNFFPHGGGFLEPECPEKQVQMQREGNTLGVFYTQSIDIPSSPSEPSDESMDTSDNVKDFGDPPERFAVSLCPMKANVIKLMKVLGAGQRFQRNEPTLVNRSTTDARRSFCPPRTSVSNKPASSSTALASR